MPRKSKQVMFDDDNPEWTQAEFASALPAHEALGHIARAFPKTRGPQNSPTKVPVSIRLSRDVLELYRSGGAGWQSRLDADLRKLKKLG